MNALEWEVDAHTADLIRDGLCLHVMHVAPHRKHAGRRVTVDLAKVTAEAWGDALTEAEARQRIAEQEARMHGAGGLF